MLIRIATIEDSAAITVIYNHAVRNSTAIFNDVEVDAENRASWMAERQSNGFPVLVAEGDGILGYASYGPFRPFDGFRATVEHSVYVSDTARGRGVGRALLTALIDQASAQRRHVMVAGIEAENSASLRLHQSLGFVETGRMPQVGQKFGRWLDLVFLQRQLDDRGSPV